MEPEKEEISPDHSVAEGENPEENPMLSTSQGKISKLESDVFGLLQSFVYTLVVIVIVFSFVAPITRVSGESMEPTLFDGEVLMVWALMYQAEAGDIVIITDPTVARLEGQSIVKRVIAVAGDVVEIRYDSNEVLVNGVALVEDYILEEMRAIYYGGGEEFTVPEGTVFVLGDNRNHSSDSRDPDIGMVEEGYIIGKVICGVWPSSAWRTF